MKRKNILLLLAALSSIGFCYGQAPVRILNLADYPVQLVDFDDMEISFQRHSSVWRRIVIQTGGK